MMKNFTPIDTIAAAVGDCVEKKIAVSVLAAKYKVHPSTIRKWVKKAGKTLPSKEQATTPKKPENRRSSTISPQPKIQPGN